MPRSKLPINFNVLYCWWNCLASFAKSFFIVQARSNWLHFLWILLKKNNVYSLISIRQNYNFDMLASIWHEIVSWFLTISKDLRNMITKLFISVQNNFMITTNKNSEKRGKKHKSTNNAMLNDGSSIEIIDRSHGD